MFKARMDVWMDGRTDRHIDGRMDIWMDKKAARWLGRRSTNKSTIHTILIKIMSKEVSFTFQN